MNTYDVVIIGYAVNQKSGGYGDDRYTFLKTIGAKYLYRNCFLDTYCAEPMAFMQLAAQIEDRGLSVEVLDGLILGYNKTTMLEQIKRLESNIFCFSIYESTKTDIYEMIHTLKKQRKGVTVILGGPYATIAADEIMAENSEVDYIVVGDGDIAMPELIYRLKNKMDCHSVSNLYYRETANVVITEAKCVDLNKILPPKRLYSDIIIRDGYSFSISSARGCGYASCSFCYLKKYQQVGGQPKFRYKDPCIVLDEIKDLIDKFAITKLSFCDEDFFGNKDGVERALKLFQMLIEENIHIDLHVNARAKTVIWLAKNNYLELCAQAGVRYMYVGLESYNDEALERYDKGITTADIDYVTSELERYHILINPGLITFDPLLAIDDVKRNVDLFKRIYYYDAFMFTRRLVIYPNAPQKIRTLYNEGEYFASPDTKALYEAMCKYRDLVFPYYMELNRDIVTDDLKELLIWLHYECFEQVYQLLKAGDSDWENAVNIKSNRAISTICDAISKKRR